MRGDSGRASDDARVRMVSIAIFIFHLFLSCAITLICIHCLTVCNLFIAIIRTVEKLMSCHVDVSAFCRFV